jgi:transcriptional regulator with XRE-family HTH domain
MLGEALKIWRIEGNMTMEELGKRAGVTQEAISRYEAEERLPEPEVFKTIVSSLGVSYKEASRLYTATALKRAYEKTIERLGVDIDFKDVIGKIYSMEDKLK